MSTDNRRKYLQILKMVFSDDPAVDVPIATRAIALLDEEQREEFMKFHAVIGGLFTFIKEEIDLVVAGLSEDFSDEDPRKWDMGDWGTFELAITGNKFEEIIRAYAHGKDNIKLIWKEIDSRLDLS